MLLNLVVDAQDAIADGGTTIVRTDVIALQHDQVGTLAAGRYVRVGITDNDAGMSPGVAARAVEPFSTTKAVGKGTGMGLSQVYGLIRQSGGDMVIAKQLGKGTTIWLYLPALVGQADEEAFVEAGNDTVLIVDDQLGVLHVAIELFRSMDYEVLPANNGADALDILKTTPGIDVLFSDMVMPGMSGVALANAARELNCNITVILASGCGRPALSVEHPDIDSFHFISKPYRMSEIVKKLRMAGTATGA